MSKDTGAGKGDSPRNCFSKRFKDNYDKIKWRADEQAGEDKGAPVKSKD